MLVRRHLIQIIAISPFMGGRPKGANSASSRLHAASLTQRFMHGP